jgi:hypothetical protein
MTYCQNCGHDSHCGVNYMRTERDWRGKLLGEIVVCNYCRCALCNKESIETHSAWGDAMTTKNME